MIANPQIENGHLDLANELVEALAKTYMSSYESQILWAIFRKTYCWHKKTDWIAFSQFRELTGMKDPNISRTLKKLVDRKIVIRMGKEYGLNKSYPNWQVKLSKQITQVIQTDKKKLSKQLDTKEKPKETITKETIQKKELITDFQREEIIKSLASKGIAPELVNLEINKFISYWTEKNHTGTKERWQMEKTFEVSRRLGRWLSNVNKFGGINDRVVIG